MCLPTYTCTNRYTVKPAPVLTCGGMFPGRTWGRMRCTHLPPLDTDNICSPESADAWSGAVICVKNPDTRPTSSFHMPMYVFVKFYNRMHHSWLLKVFLDFSQPFSLLSSPALTPETTLYVSCMHTYTWPPIQRVDGYG